MRRRSLWGGDAVEAFLSTGAHSRLEIAWHLLAVAGLRVGEVLALRWADVDASTGLIHVRHAVVGVPYAALALPASASGERVVDAHPVFDALERHHRRQEAARSEWGAEYDDGGLVVCRADGRPIHPRDLHHAFTCSVREAGLPAIRLHDLRRSWRLASPAKARP